jgi:poly(A) polymerase
VKTPKDLAAQLAISTLTNRVPVVTALATIFKQAGFTLALVGGPVRDAVLGRLGNDLDFTTNARPIEAKVMTPKVESLM